MSSVFDSMDEIYLFSGTIAGAVAFADTSANIFADTLDKCQIV